MQNESGACSIDVKAFAEAAAPLTGRDTVRRYPRLSTETGGQGDERSVTWSASGELRNPKHVLPDVWLHLQAETSLPMTCQRCLGPVDVLVAVHRSFRFVADEATAAAQDDLSEEDVLVASRSFDLAALIEDELLMELPAAPRHETCPDPGPMTATDAEFEAASRQRDRPFTVLETLKTGKR